MLWRLIASLSLRYRKGIFPLVCLYSFSQPWWIGIVGASLIGKWQSQKIPMFFLALTGAVRIEDPRVA
jgi:hypothetical protein